MKKNLIKIMSILLMGATLVTGCSKNEVVKNAETRIEDSGMWFDEIRNKISTTDEYTDGISYLVDLMSNVN